MAHIEMLDFKFIINFEYVAELIFIVMLVYMFVQKKYLVKRSRAFMWIITLNFINTAFDIFASNLLNYIIADPSLKDKYLLLANILSNIYFLLLFGSIFAFAVYVILITCGLEYMHKRPLRAILFYTPAIVVIVITFINFFTCSFIYYDFKDCLIMDINIISFIAYVGMAAIYLIYAILEMFRFKTIFEKKQLLAITLVLPIMFAGMLGEIFAPQALVISFMVAILIILVQSVLESSEDLIDPKTNLPNLEEFNKVIKKAFFTKDKNKTVVLIKIANYNELASSYSTTIINEYLKKISKTIVKFKKIRKSKDDIYSLNNGYYAVVCNKKNYPHKNPMDIYRTDVSNGSFSNFGTKYKFCYFEPFNDFENADEALNFVNNYRQTIKLDEEYIKYSDVKNNKELILQNNLEKIIDTGLKENEFVVFYQPIYSVKDKKFKTAEALVRLNSKKYGFIPPNSFIPYAEYSGRIAEIDGFVMEEVFKFVSSPQFDELGLDYIEINLSMAECANKILVERIKKLKEKYNIDTKKINLEITESFDLNDQAEISRNLNRLVDMGFELSLDDYGTGYSNINRFSTLPISIIKIDKSLVDECEDESIQKILGFSFDLVKELDKKTVVEGVETEAQLKLFEKYGADYIQGFYFSKPLAFKKYVEFLKNN